MMCVCVYVCTNWSAGVQLQGEVARVAVDRAQLQCLVCGVDQWDVQPGPPENTNSLGGVVCVCVCGACISVCESLLVHLISLCT